MSDTAQTIQQLLLANPLREPLLREVIQALSLPPGSHGLDVGCGIGLQALLLAAAVGADGHITGVDVAPELLAFGEDLAAQAGLAKQITLRQGDMNQLPWATHTFDWAWSVDCVGYPAGALQSALAELVRVVKPVGHITILGWSGQQLLPGHPLLEARLNATCSAYAPFLAGEPPTRHFLRALSEFRAAGLQQVEAQTFVGQVQAPLSEGQRAALTALLGMLWLEPPHGVAAQEWLAYQRLCLPGGEDFILDTPDYYGFFTYTLFRGQMSL